MPMLPARFTARWPSPNLWLFRIFSSFNRDWKKRRLQRGPFTPGEIETLAAYWNGQVGAERVSIISEAGIPAGVKVNTVGDNYLNITAKGVRLEGAGVDPETVRAVMKHALQAWGGQCYINPRLPYEVKLMAWVMARDEGVKINYVPPLYAQLHYRRGGWPLQRYTWSRRQRADRAARAADFGAGAGGLRQSLRQEPVLSHIEPRLAPPSAAPMPEPAGLTVPFVIPASLGAERRRMERELDVRRARVNMRKGAHDYLRLRRATDAAKATDALLRDADPRAQSPFASAAPWAVYGTAAPRASGYSSTRPIGDYRNVGDNSGIGRGPV